MGKKQQRFQTSRNVRTGGDDIKGGGVLLVETVKLTKKRYKKPRGFLSSFFERKNVFVDKGLGT